MTWRRAGYWFAIGALALGLGLCAVLSQRTLSSDLRTRDGLRALLLRLRQLDADLGKGVLASRYGLVNQYDALTQSNAMLDAGRAELRSRVSEGLSLDARTEGAVRRLEDAELALYSDVERFKTANSVLRNSLLYLPLAGDSLARRLGQEHLPSSSDLAARVHTLVRSALIYNLLKADALRDSLASQENELGASSNALPERLRPDLAQFLRHAQTVVRQQDVVDPMVARISASPLAPSLRELEELSEELLDRDAARLMNRYRIASSALVALLIGLLGLFGYKLKRLYASLELQVLERTQKLAREKLALEHAERAARLNETRINAIIAGAREGIIRLGPDGLVRSCNPAAAQMFEAPCCATQGMSFVEFAVSAEARPDFIAWLSRADTDGRIDPADYWRELPLISATKRVFAAECSVARRNPAMDNETTLFVRDVSRARELEAELRQAQKLESVGRLAAGIAHEINTPIQFVNDSCFFIGEAIKTAFQLVERYASLLTDSVQEHLRETTLAAAARLEAEADLPYLLTAVPQSLETMLDGLSRVAELVAGMNTFAYPHQKEMVPVELNRALTNTLTIARNEYKYVAELETDLADLPPVMCHAGEVNQVILNIVVNAAHAIADRVKGTDQRGRITVRTRLDQENVVISIADTGNGIPHDVRGRIFDPFFTTKELGRGTGQGLAIARSVVVDKHGGELTFETELGVGTTFHVCLPIAGRARDVRSAA